MERSALDLGVGAGNQTSRPRVSGVDSLAEYAPGWVRQIGCKHYVATGVETSRLEVACMGVATRRWVAKPRDN